MVGSRWVIFIRAEHQSAEVSSAHIENRRRMPQQPKKAVVDNRGLRTPGMSETRVCCNFLRRQRIDQDAGKRNGQYHHGKRTEAAIAE
jgi:hypothetical protein